MLGSNPSAESMSKASVLNALSGTLVASTFFVCL
jgi:hypothetical protein